MVRCNINLGLRGLDTLAFVFVVVLSQAPVQAHRLEAEPQVRVVQKIKIESWFDLTGDSPAGAKVEVFRKSDGQLLIEDKLNEKGEFTFYADLEPLRVVVSAGEGHSKELEIIPDPKTNITDATAPLPAADRGTKVTVKDVLLGIGFLLAGAAFGMSWRNARRLHILKTGQGNGGSEGKSL